MNGSTIITTHIRSDSDDFDIRREFCGVQDKRLNDLRQFTSCIIDLQTHGIKDPFEKVTWVISHYDAAVRDFVVKRIQSWSQITQITAQIHKEDSIFRQQILSDSSSSSIDVKGQQLGFSMKSSPSPSTSSARLMLNKKCKTPTHDYHFDGVPPAALVPQTDLRSRQLPRRRRNSSSSGSGTRRPVLFGKSSDYNFSRTNNCTDGLSLVKPSDEKEDSFDIKQVQSQESHSDAGYDDVDFEEDAKWANLLSDTSDFEDDSNPFMADIILVSQLRDRLVHSKLSSADTVTYIQSLLGSSLSLIGNEQLKTLNNQPVWFYRLILNSRIILSDGIHKSREQAQKLAYEKMIQLMTNKQGVQPKIISNGRCKIVLRKCSSPKRTDETTMHDSIMNSINNDY